ncbi:OLC1v1017624C1 [Oldenlandia corymbosa var. corymbosa]|uniref:OLC1v1017624C1 n=1 Tax=Oldenlandia corymbosa var. corymbosa TaxID=529605 RepID=A0AAV1EA25_OLDCO|nr:OLC1v1017624C1 [Oldenlandia corymbosa var. corymbosa]
MTGIKTPVAKIPSSTYGVCLLASILINIFLIAYFLQKGRWNSELKSWSEVAAAEAEAVASIKCSGHGRAYVDGLRIDGKPVCECSSCYQGPDCSKINPDCPADAERFHFKSKS